MRNSEWRLQQSYSWSLSNAFPMAFTQKSRPENGWSMCFSSPYFAYRYTVTWDLHESTCFFLISWKGSQAISEILRQKISQIRLIQGQPYLFLHGISSWNPDPETFFSRWSRNFTISQHLPRDGFSTAPRLQAHLHIWWGPSELDQAHLMQRSRLPSWCTWEHFVADGPMDGVGDIAVGIANRPIPQRTPVAPEG